MYFEDNNFYKELFVKKDFTEVYEDKSKDFIYKVVPEDFGHLYRQNIYGFRSGRFDKESEIVIAGCSVTYGAGVAEENIWSSVLGEKFKKRTSSVAMSGVSTSWLVDQLLIYFRKYGNPKMVLCLFPDLFRINLPVDGNYYKNKNEKPKYLINEFSYFSHFHPEPPKAEIYNKYLKMPYDYEKAISPYLAINQNIKSIRYLEQYCNSNGIKLLWSTWSEKFSDTINAIKDIEELKFDNYFDIREYGHIVSTKLFKTYRKNICFNSIEDMKKCRESHTYEECSCYLDCHSDLRGKIGEEFDYGTDNKDRLEASHPGAHYHLHCSEAFEKRLKELGWV